MRIKVGKTITIGIRQNMKINVASQNEVKINAVKEIILDYPLLASGEVSGVDVSSGVSEQPKTLEETLRGAMNRAKEAFQHCDYSFGIESGLIEVPYTKTGYMDLTACIIYDGTENYVGLSSAWEIPEVVHKFVKEEGCDLNEATYKAGLSQSTKVGSAEGLIGIMTKGRLTRKEYTKEALRTALIHLEHN